MDWAILIKDKNIEQDNNRDRHTNEPEQYTFHEKAS